MENLKKFLLKRVTNDKTDNNYKSLKKIKAESRRSALKDPELIK
jgi:hypothetical protein